MTRQRLDVVLAESHAVASRHQAQQVIASGMVRVNGRLALKPSQIIQDGDDVVVDAESWVSRGAHKLLGALDDCGMTVPGRCLDAGASTGGFTQVLLARGATRVYAVDVGHGQMAPQVASDPRVAVMEGVNLKDLRLQDLDGVPVGLAVADLSFISLTAVLPALLPLIEPSGHALLLVKPQFEVGREELPSSGVVRDDGQRRAAVDNVAAAASALGWSERWRGPSHLPGAHGNVEFFLLLGECSTTLSTG